MKYRKLGNSGLKVSEISLGSWLTYGGYVECENAAKSIHKAYKGKHVSSDTAGIIALPCMRYSRVCLIH